jgi:sterol O-acyltransferase
MNPHGSGTPNFDLLIWGIFEQLNLFLYYWFLMLISSFLTLYLAHFTLTSQNTLIKGFFILLYMGYQVISFLYSAWVVSSNPYSSKPFPLPLAIGFMAEQARLSMKIHSYYREKICCEYFQYQFSAKPQSVYYPHAKSSLSIAIPTYDYMYSEFVKFLYFLFAPTLLYRDSYPRTRTIRWHVVIYRLFEFMAIIYYAFLVFRQVLPWFIETANQPLTWVGFLKSLFLCM